MCESKGNMVTGLGGGSLGTLYFAGFLYLRAAETSVGQKQLEY